MQQFIRWSGISNITAGVLLLFFWYLYALLLPYAQLSTTLAILVENRYWVFVNILGVAGTLISLIGLFGIYAHAADKLPQSGLIGFIIAFVGTILLLATQIWDTVLWPILVNHDEALPPYPSEAGP